MQPQAGAELEFLELLELLPRLLLCFTCIVAYYLGYNLSRWWHGKGVGQPDITQAIYWLGISAAQG